MNKNYSAYEALTGFVLLVSKLTMPGWAGFNPA